MQTHDDMREQLTRQLARLGHHINRSLAADKKMRRAAEEIHGKAVESLGQSDPEDPESWPVREVHLRNRARAQTAADMLDRRHE